MIILFYIIEYIGVGLVMSVLWNKMRNAYGKEKNNTFYTILDILLWPLALIARTIGYVEGFIEGFIEAIKGS